MATRCAGLNLASAALLTLLVATTARAVAQRAASAGPGTDQAVISAPNGTFFFGLTPQFAISPDGRQLVFVANATGTPPALWVRAVNSTTARQLVGTEQASYPFWSADSQRVGFFASGKLKTVAAAGGAPTIVCDAPTGRGGTWSQDNTIVFASGISDPLRKVPAGGGTPTPATVVDTSRENSHRWPQFLPDGRHVLFWAGAGTGRPELKIASLDTPAVVSLGPSDSNGAYASGYVFYKSGPGLVALPFDATTLTKKGDPLQVVEPISTDAGSFFASFAVSTNGTVAYTRGSARPLVLTWFNRSGKPVGTVGEPGLYTNATLSPDGKRIAVSLTAGTPANRDVWILDAIGGAATRVTTDAAVDATPFWSPDGTSVVFSSQRAGPYQMYRRSLSGTASDDELLLKDDTATIATDWSTDGWIVYTRTGKATGLDVWIMHLASKKTAPVVETPASEDTGAFSPDGFWIAYQSNASGRDEVYIRRTPAIIDAGPSGPVQVSRAGGTQPRWRGDGKELFYLAPDGSVMAAPIADGGKAGAAATLLPAAMTLVIRHSYTVAKDGQQFLMPVVDQRNPPTITTVLNWGK